MVKMTINQDMCKGCALCVRACPKNIMALSEKTLNAKGYHPAECTDLSACIACAACARTCPDAVIGIEKD